MGDLDNIIGGIVDDLAAMEDAQTNKIFQQVLHLELPRGDTFPDWVRSKVEHRTPVALVSYRSGFYNWETFGHETYISVYLITSSKRDQVDASEGGAQSGEVGMLDLLDLVAEELDGTEVYTGFDTFYLAASQIKADPHIIVCRITLVVYGATFTLGAITVKERNDQAAAMRKHLASCAIDVGTESANTIRLTFTITDSNGDAVTEKMPIRVVIADSEYGEVTADTGPTLTRSVITGQLIRVDKANDMDGRYLTDATGVLVIDLICTSADTYYAMAEVGARVFTSTAITFA